MKNATALFNTISLILSSTAYKKTGFKDHVVRKNEPAILINYLPEWKSVTTRSVIEMKESAIYNATAFQHFIVTIEKMKEPEGWTKAGSMTLSYIDTTIVLNR